jgi:Mg-chelatase subunit ChlI
MDYTRDRQQLIEEINLIPDSHLRQLFDLLHSFRIGLEAAEQEGIATSAPQTTLVLASLAGSWKAA